MTTLSLLVLIALTLPLGYWVLQALASVRKQPPLDISKHRPSHRFAIAIPAHNEEMVISYTIQQLQRLNYPCEMFSIHVVADHCDDHTAELARSAGALVHERGQGPRGGKGEALSWLLGRILDDRYDAVVIFDADTQVDPDFLLFMDVRLDRGEQVIQGQHIIINPEQGWFPALTYAMFIVDNRFQNVGRCNLGWSAKNMGDSICFRADVLHRIGWGQGLTEDFQLRQRLLLENIKISYEPAARGYGEAPIRWMQFWAQRARWLMGARNAIQQFGWRLLIEGAKRRDMALLDGAFQAYFPSYSTLTILGFCAVMIQVLINCFVRPTFSWMLIGAWVTFIAILAIYPFMGLALEKAPVRAYLAILSGPVFIIHRTLLAFYARHGTKSADWIRTPHGDNLTK
jgi:cellulose synthase/poly-beta-1,6-N-acetylglucosamine synthase-like glycosyltransferase